MVATLNPDYELIYVDKEADKVFLKNLFFKNLVSLSTVEYEIIQFYSKNPDPQQVFHHFAEQYEMPADFIYLLVQKAEASGLLVSDGYLQRKEKVLTTSNKRADNTWLYWTVAKIQSFLQAIGLNARIDLRGSFKYFRLLSFDLEKTWLEKVCSNKVVQTTLLIVYFAAFGALLYGIFQIDSHKLGWNFAKIGHSQQGLAILVLFGGIVIVSFLHELGHFILYKKFGGVTSEMGIALMTGIIPTLYVTTSSLPLWRSRWQRLLVMAGGCIVDLLLLVVFIYIGYTTNSGVVSYYAFMFSFMQVYRLYFNSNPLIPRTDGYFIMCDVLSNPTLHSTAYTHAVELLKKLKTIKITTVTTKEIIYTLYFSFSILFMILNYLMFLLPLTLFFI
jgi:hypothetical protein